MDIIKKIIIGSRGSDLALWQAHFVQNELTQLGIDSEIKIIVTKGDAIQHLSFDKIEGKGFFTKEIEDALLQQEIDLAVHSLKDLPTTSPPGLHIAALSYREDPRDLLIIRKDAIQLDQPLHIRANAIIGTSSARRKTQIKLLQSNLITNDLRGNVPTRINKCRNGQYDAIVLAAAGVNRLRLDLSEFELQYLEPDLFVPAPAQGVLGLQTRSDDHTTIEIISKLHHAEVAEVVDIERQILNRFDGGCHMPVGVHCTKDGDRFNLTIAKAQHDQQLPLKIQIQGTDPKLLIETGMEKALKTRSGHIYVSKDSTQWPNLYAQLSAHGYEPHFESLIHTETKANPSILPAADWLFFISRNCVRHFLSTYGLKSALQYKIAAVGPGTAAECYKSGLQPDFIGKSNDLSVVANAFVTHASEGTLIFPIGNRSRRTIQKQLEADFKVVEIEIYETHTVTKSFDQAFSALVFTSPSNAEAYFSANRVHTEQLLVAMGETTATYLRNVGFTNLVISSGFREDQVAMALFSHL